MGACALVNVHVLLHVLFILWCTSPFFARVTFFFIAELTRHWVFVLPNRGRMCFGQCTCPVTRLVHFLVYVTLFCKSQVFSLLKLPAIGCLFYPIVGACALVSVHFLFHVLFILWCLRGANSSGGKKMGGHKLKVDQSQDLSNSFLFYGGQWGQERVGKKGLRLTSRST